MFVKEDEFHVWDAIVFWRDSVYEADYLNVTKANYISGLLKLIESAVIDIRLQLHKIDECWLIESKQKIDDHLQWSAETKSIRKSCLNSFYNFTKNEFDYEMIPYRSHPKPNEIKHILSSVQDKVLTKDIPPIDLLVALSKINERDVFIVYLMMATGRTLKEILELRKVKEDYEPPYVRFNGFGVYIKPHITEKIDEICEKSTVYLFETASSKRLHRTQITRNLKQAGFNIGLEFDLTPKLLHGYVNAYMSRDKRSEIEKALFF